MLEIPVPIRPEHAEFLVAAVRVMKLSNSEALMLLLATFFALAEGLEIPVDVVQAISVAARKAAPELLEAMRIVIVPTAKGDA